MTSKTPRTGNQYSIHYGDYSAVICELGAKIRRFDYQGKEIFCPFGVNDLTPTCNGYVLAPWPNRIENGEYDFNGKHYCAPVNEYHPAPRNNANHGYAYHYMWKLESLTDSAVTLSLRFPNLDGYPFDVTVTVTYELGDNGMTATVNARNDGDEPAPWALGLHPWLANGKQGATAAERDADSAACHAREVRQPHPKMRNRYSDTFLTSISYHKKNRLSSKKRSRPSHRDQNSRPLVRSFDNVTPKKVYISICVFLTDIS